MNGKMTKRDWFEALDSIVYASDLEDRDGAHEFLQHEIALLDSNKARDRERTAKKAQDDPLRIQTYCALTEDFRTIADIYDQLVEENPDEEITVAKVTNRLSRLVRDGLAEKTVVREGTRRISAYKGLQVEDAGE